MKISTKGRYAVRMMADIAENGTPYATLKAVAERQGISKKYLEQIALRMTASGFLRGIRGFQGGYSLAKDPGEISVLAILTAAEGSMAVVACLEDEPNQCPHSGECKTLPLWIGLQKRIDEYLGGITLADVVAGTLAPADVTAPVNKS